MKIPQKYIALRRYALGRLLLRVGGFVGWLLLWIGAAVSYNQNHQTYPAHRRFVGWRMALLAALAVASGILIFRLWQLYTDRTKHGVILSAGISRTHGAAKEDDTTGDDHEVRLNTALVLQDDDGKKHRLRFEQKNGFYHYYHEGNRIVRLRGLTYPIHLDPNAPHGYVCSVCGRWTAKYTPQCEGCHHPVIHPAELCESREPAPKE